MSTLTKKLHILKTGETEETCDIYTTPEEVGGSPYLALEVDGQKGYVKLGSATDANATHLRVKKDGTTYAAWKKATAAVPTGNITIQGSGYFTVPQGITVLYIIGEFAPVYVGVTPNTTHEIGVQLEEIHENLFQVTVGCSSHSIVYTTEMIQTDYGEDPSYLESIQILWSPEINKRAPNVNDY